MKQTEFRGKRVGGGEWVYGDLLHDKDGRPHIVPNEYIGEAIFKSGMFARKVKNVSASLSSLLLATEVIGNIHDNPELLKTE